MDKYLHHKLYENSDALCKDVNKHPTWEIVQIIELFRGVKLYYKDYLETE